MSSPPKSPANDAASSPASSDRDEQPAGDDTITISDIGRQVQNQESAPESQDGQHYSSTSSPSPPPADIPPFDWEDFEARYAKALQETDEEEKDILKEAEALSKVGFHSIRLTAPRFVDSRW